MIYKIFMPDRQHLATRGAWIMCHPGRYLNCEFQEGDLIELEEGIFILNDDLNPMELATPEQIEQA